MKFKYLTAFLVHKKKSITLTVILFQFIILKCRQASVVINKSFIEYHDTNIDILCLRVKVIYLINVNNLKNIGHDFSFHNWNDGLFHWKLMDTSHFKNG